MDEERGDGGRAGKMDGERWIDGAKDGWRLDRGLMETCRGD